MNYVEYFSANPFMFAMVCGFLGLLVGSFLNVVIYRLPLMLEKGWREECLEFLQETRAEEANTEKAKAEKSNSEEFKTEKAEKADQRPRFDLIMPGSHCPKCQHKIKAWENIPVFSYLFLGRKCSQCSTPISFRYPFVELLTGVLSFAVAWHFGFGEQAFAGLVFTWLLITLSFIDYDTQLLPDVITIPMVWMGLLLSLWSVYVDSTASIIGAVAGYLSLWTVFQAFKLATGKEGMGFGDFKLLAVLGAWLGWKMLPVIILLSSLAGAVIGITLIVIKRLNKDKPIPFGPYLAIAGWIAMIYGEELVAQYFKIYGISAL